MSIFRFLQNQSIKKLTYFTKDFKKVTFFCKFFVSKRNMNSKPPNIFIFTGNDCPTLYKSVENNLLQCLRTHHYLTYHLLSSEIETQPWSENTTLLVVTCDEMDNNIALTFEKYFHNSGKILLICSKFDKLHSGKCMVKTNNKNILIPVKIKDIGETLIYRGKYSYSFSGSTVLYCDSSNTPVVHKMMYNKGIIVASEVYIDRDPEILCEDFVPPEYDRSKCLMMLKYILTQEFDLKVKTDKSVIPQLSPGYFMSDRKLLDMGVTSDLNLNICEDKPVFRECSLPSMEIETKVPVFYNTEDVLKSISFDKNLYFSKLNTDIYGHCLVYFPVISSTMDIVGQFSDYEGIIIVAGCQISGKARGRNKWISPAGCAMFTLEFTLPLFSNLGQKLPLIQHMAALSVVHGIRNQEQYKMLNLKLKWPNDIYFDNIKIGGLIVASSIQGKLAHVSIGWGINVANEHPTTCVNSAISKFSLENSCNLSYLQTEEVIANTVSQMEYFVKDFQKSGADMFFKYYYSYWMHDHQEVSLVNLNKKGIIMGLDDYGFLLVKTDEGKEISLQPDGNRFDIMRNLILSKE